MLRIRDVYPGSESLHPVSESLHPGTRVHIKKSKNISLTQKMFIRKKILVVHPGSGFWFFTHPGSRGQKRHRIPDPDPQHCVLLWKFVNIWSRKHKKLPHVSVSLINLLALLLLISLLLVVLPLVRLVVGIRKDVRRLYFLPRGLIMIRKSINKPIRIRNTINL